MRQAGEVCAWMRAARGEALALLVEGTDGPPAEELLARFRSHCPESEHHTVLLLRRADRARVGRLLAAGADDCLRLPLDPEELERRLMVAAGAVARGRRLRDSLREEGLRDPETRLLSLGCATVDRLRHNAHRVVIEGDSFRSPRPPSTAPKRGSS